MIEQGAYLHSLAIMDTTYGASNHFIFSWLKNP